MDLSIYNMRGGQWCWFFCVSTVKLQWAMMMFTDDGGKEN